MRKEPELTATDTLKMLGLKTFKSLQMKLKSGELVPYVLSADEQEWIPKQYGVRDRHPKWYYYKAHVQAYKREHAPQDVPQVSDDAMRAEIISIANVLGQSGDIPRMEVFAAMRDRHRDIGMRRMHKLVRSVLNNQYGVRPYKQARKKRA